MAQPTSDQRARLLKELASEVKKLRGWAASDESVAERLSDALNELTAQRLLAHQFAPAVEDAQDALTRANRLVAAHGAVGPFTPVDDGVRFFTATAHLAATHAGAGHPALGGQMATALRGWMGLLPHVDLTPYVGARTAVLLLMAQAQAALAAGDVGSANAYADAATARAREGGLASGDDASLLVDALRLAADARWVAGVPHDAVALSREAVDAAGAVAAPVLSAPGRVADSWAERALTPVVAARRDLADRLLASGDADAGLRGRRGLAELLLTHSGRLGAPARDALAHTLADLAHDLLGLDDLDGALEAAGRAADVAGELTATEAAVGDHLGAQFAAVTQLARVLLRREEHEEAAEAVASLFDRYASLRRPAGFEAALAGATLVRAEVERAAGDQEAAERSLREFHGLVSGLRGEGPDKGLYASVSDEAFARDRFRGVATRSPLPTPSWSNLSDADALAAATRAPLAVPAPEAPVVEITEAPVRAPEPEPVVVVEPEPQPDVVEPEPQPDVVEPEPQPDVVEPEPQADVVEHEPVMVEPEPVWEPEAEPVDEPMWQPEPTPEPVAPEPQPAASGPSELELAQTALASAKASGNRRDTLAAAQSLVDVLRPLASTDRDRALDLISALEELGEAKFRAGDWWGSRAPKKEAKQLAKELGL